MADPRWFTYLVRCSDDSIYCGVTPDLERRVRMHNEGRAAKYTKGRGPVTLVWAEILPGKREAMVAEAELKSMNRAAKEAVIGPVPDPVLRERQLLMWSILSKRFTFPTSVETAAKLVHSPTSVKVCLTRFSWAVATSQAVKAIASLSPVVEMGAGGGYWASLIRKTGADIIAFDQSGRGSPLPANLWVPGPSKRGVRYGIPSVLSHYADRSLFLCWPPQGTMAMECLQHWRGANLAYVGDFQGVTASPAFYKSLRAQFRKVDEVAIPQWIGARDSLTIWTRK